MNGSDRTTDKASGGAALPAGTEDRSAGPRRQPGNGGKVQQAGDSAVGGKGQGERQGFDRQRLDPQDSPPAEVLDDENVAGDKDFELKPPGGG